MSAEGADLGADAGKVSRNAPCPCGSGKKYKRCCLGKNAPIAGTRSAPPAAAPARSPVERGLEHHRAGQLEPAIEWYRKAIRRDKKDARAHFFLGQALGQAGRRAEGIEVLRRAIRLDATQPLYHSNLAALLLKEGKPEEALEAGQCAVKLDPSNALSHSVIGACFERTNELDKAGDAFTRAIEADPDHADALLALGCLRRRQGRFDDAQEHLRRVLDLPLPPEFKHQAWKELGVVLERLGQYDEAFEALEEGGRVCLATQEAQRVDPQGSFKRIEMYRSGMTPELLSRWTPEDFAGDRGTPAFLVGFPRSGTTMTEQILDAHPSVQTADERPMVRMLKERIRQIVGAGDLPDLLAKLDRDGIAKLRAGYWEDAEALLGPIETPVFLDKLPLHLIDIGLLNVVFPDARVILALRDPRDVCLSCFTQRFGLNSAMINFLSWETTGAFYAAVMGLWLELKDHLTLSVATVRYEDTVSDLKGEGTRILEHLGLQWDEGLMSFHERAAEKFISTPSYAAVTQPVNRKAVGKWANYPRQIERIRTSLAPYMDQFGYRSTN